MDFFMGFLALITFYACSWGIVSESNIVFDNLVLPVLFFVLYALGLFCAGVAVSFIIIV